MNTVEEKGKTVEYPFVQGEKNDIKYATLLILSFIRQMLT